MVLINKPCTYYLNSVRFTKKPDHMFISLSPGNPVIINPQQQSPQRWHPRRHHSLAAGGLKSRGNPANSPPLTHASTDQPQTKIVQPWLINGVFTDRYDAGQMYRLLVR